MILLYISPKKYSLVVVDEIAVLSLGFIVIFPVAKLISAVNALCIPPKSATNILSIYIHISSRII